MGLTIHYTISARRALAEHEVRRLVATASHAVNALVQKRGHGSVTRMGEINPDEFSFWAPLERVIGGRNLSIDVPPLRGYGFVLDPGEECEDAVFGLCKYPSTFDLGDGTRIRTRLDRWQLLSCCKTQYADIVGWKHFLTCHELVVSAALVWKRLGLDVKIIDEGSYWPGRSITRLRANLTDYNHLIAGLGGALKDAADTENGDSVESPIFAHPRFERLEAEAQTARFPTYPPSRMRKHGSP